MAIVVLSMVITAVTQAVVSGQQHGWVAMQTQRGVALTEAMMEEILAADYVDPQGGSGLGRDEGEARRVDFDDVDDYDGFVEEFGQVRDASGASYGDEFADYARRVDVAVATLSHADLGEAAPGREIVVTVTSRRGGTWTLRRFVAEPWDPDA